MASGQAVGRLSTHRTFAPGFLFEFLVLPVWLIVKGFTTPSAAKTSRSPVLATAR
jgi:hypothetical protein